MKDTRIAVAGCGLILVMVVASFGFILAMAAAGWIHHLREATYPAIGMAIIEDIEGNRIAVEPTFAEVWDQLVALYHSKEELWIGGVVEVFVLFRPDPNYPWGFRFKPENITVAEVTAEGLQTTIRGISEDVGYWIRIGQAYVFAKVVEIHAHM